jgi:hypothetical protein
MKIYYYEKKNDIQNFEGRNKINPWQHNYSPTKHSITKQHITIIPFQIQQKLYYS